MTPRQIFEHLSTCADTFTSICPLGSVSWPPRHWAMCQIITQCPVIGSDIRIIIWVLGC